MKTIFTLLFSLLCCPLVGQQVINIAPAITKDTSQPFPVHYIDVTVSYALPGEGYRIELEMKPETWYRGVLVPRIDNHGVERALQTTTLTPTPKYTGVSWPRVTSTDGNTFLVTEKLPVIVRGFSAFNNEAIITNKQFTISPNIATWVPTGGGVDGYIVPHQTGSATMTVTGLNKNNIQLSEILPFNVAEAQIQAMTTINKTFRICAVPGTHKQFNGGAEYIPTSNTYALTEQLTLTNYLFSAKVFDANTSQLLDQQNLSFAAPQ